ncbi:hypothetical protein DAKH74_039930 [Maudiozyma humilis]|uniref:Helicase C-terminal domain-containing protein n=1 Tax=Maudiozyma humilis TaxID=51915 RepID=A0AAV5S198_MAUHU|nr:hypothetical protein DAKH74_039930 [Kazachstania humilis]
MGRMTVPGSGILTLTGGSTSEEKMSVMREFKQNPNHRVIVGTVVITEGIDIPDVNLVILAHQIPSIPSFIQTVGRLRGSGKVVVLYRKNYKKRNDQVPQLDPAVDLNTQIRKFYFGEAASVVEKVAKPVEEEAPGSISEEEFNPVEDDMDIPVEEEAQGPVEEEVHGPVDEGAPSPVEVEANPVAKSVSKEKSDVQDGSTLIIEAPTVNSAGSVATSERTLAKPASLDVSPAGRYTGNDVLKRLPLMPLPRPAENSKAAADQAEVICLSDDEEEVIEITEGSCEIIASNGGLSSRSSGCPSPAVIEIDDGESSTTIEETPTIEDIPQFGESVETVTPADEDPGDILFGWGSSEPLPMVSLKRRSSNTLASSEPKVSKVQNSSKLSKKIAAIIGASNNVFALLGFDSAICSKLFYDTADDSAVRFNWKPVKYDCCQCFSVHKDTCACPPSGRVSIMSFARDILLFLSEILPKEEMELICKRSREEGPFTVLVGFNDKLQRYKSLYMEKYRDNLEWIKKTTKSRCLDFPQNSRWDCTYKLQFNGMWDFLSSGKRDLLLFFACGDIRSQDVDSWLCQFQGEPFERSYKRKLKASCKDLPFIIDYNNSDAFAADTLIESDLARAGWYSEDFAMAKRTTPGPAGGNRIHPSTPVNDRMHLVMGFGIYFNSQFMAYLARTTSWFPSVGSFHHWMHVLDMNITSSGQWMPSYILIGAIYWKWLEDLHSKK